MLSLVAKSGKYYGTFPAVLTNKNYKDKIGDSTPLADAQTAAEAQYDANHSSSSTTAANN